jgi:hypothetical protein
MAVVAHVEIPVTDMRRARNFYARLFDLSFGEVESIHDSRMVFFPFEEGEEGASVALAAGPIYKPSLEGAVVYFRVPDIDAALHMAVSLGSEILFPKTLQGESGYVAEVSDSEGNRLALLSP